MVLPLERVSGSSRVEREKREDKRQEKEEERRYLIIYQPRGRVVTAVRSHGMSPLLLTIIIIEMFNFNF